MRLVISGEELTVTLKSEKELTTQQVVMAHQLATGNYEALFINEETEEQKLEADSIIPHSPIQKEEVRTQVGRVEKGDWVSVEILCPFCGYTGKTSTKWGNNFCKCPGCEEKLYNKFATGVAGEVNSYGCHYVADEPMKFKVSEDEYAEMFKEESE